MTKKEEEQFEKLLNKKIAENDEAYFLLVEEKDGTYRVNSSSYKMNPYKIMGFLESKKLDIQDQIKARVNPEFRRSIISDKN